MNSIGVMDHLPESSYPQFRNFESSGTQSLPFHQPCSPIQIIPDDTCTFNPYPASYTNDENWAIATCSEENYNTATHPCLIDSRDIKTSDIDSQWIPNSLIDQISNSTDSIKSMVPVRKADLMTVEEIAAWIWMVGHVSGWEEADQYANSFQENNIGGFLLQELTLDYLKTDLGITKYWHRLKIMSAIKHLRQDMRGWDSEDDADNHQRRTPRTDGPIMGSPIYSSFPLLNEKKHSENYPEKCVLEFTSSHIDNNHTIIGDSSLVRSKNTPCKELPSKIRAKSRRARPDNPIRYKTYHKVRIRAGKSVRSNDICYLPKGSIVVINQIKGRSGRVVLQEENGEFVKLGWVTLYTKDRQLLRKCDHKKNRI